MIKHRSERIRAAAVALVVADHIHPRMERFLGNAEHISRFAGAFEAVNDNNGQRVRSIRLPMAMAKHPDARRNLDQAFLGRWHMKASLD